MTAVAAFTIVESIVTVLGFALAVSLAIQANIEAKRARTDAIANAARLQAQATVAAAAERRSMFELDVLRDLVGRLDSFNSLPQTELFQLPRKIPGIWQLIPAGELMFWQLMYDSANAMPDGPDWTKINAELEARSQDPHDKPRWQVYSALRQDLLKAIDKRVNISELSPQANATP